MENSRFFSSASPMLRTKQKHLIHTHITIFMTRSNPTAATTFQVRFASREHTSQVKTDSWKLEERSKHTHQTPNMRTFLCYLATNLSNYLSAKTVILFPFPAFIRLPRPSRFPPNQNSLSIPFQTQRLPHKLSNQQLL